MKCPRCEKTTEDMGHMTPLGWAGFAWGPQGEDPRHYYVIPEGEDIEDEDIEVIALCNVESPVSRWPKQRQEARLVAMENRSEE